MPALSSFDYAVIRVVPRVEREEFLNAGVVVFCLERQFLEARILLDETRLKALWSGVDVEQVRLHLEAFRSIAHGDASAGPVALLPLRDRFHWLVAPRSTILQVSPVHTGVCSDPASLAGPLLARMVASSSDS